MSISSVRIHTSFTGELSDNVKELVKALMVMTVFRSASDLTKLRSKLNDKYSQALPDELFVFTQVATAELTAFLDDQS